MKLKTLFIDFLRQNNLVEEAAMYESFFNDCYATPYIPELTSGVLANVALKHRFAKFIVEKCAADEIYIEPINDRRLMSMVIYYVYVRILNAAEEPGAGKAEQLLQNAGCGWFGVSHDSYGSIAGYEIYPSSDKAQTDLMPVDMRYGGHSFHAGWNTFTVNLLCFRDKKVTLGLRCDFGSLPSVICHKGCRPLRHQTDSEGNRWFLLEADTALTDDCTAVFSSPIEKDFAIEIADWVSSADRRVIFRIFRR